MRDIRIIFMGTPDFACGILKTLVENHYSVVACVTKEDKPVGRKQVMSSPAVKTLANEYNIPVLQPVSIKSEYQAILDYQPDLIITCAYGQIIPQVILDYPKYKCVNVHASLLPKYRGGAPIHYAVINGDEEAGITIMNMVAKMDAGDILAQKAIDVDLYDTTAMLFDKLMVVGCDLLMECLDDYIDGKLTPIVQDESKVSYAYNISKEMEWIDFYRDVMVVYNHIRGLISWPVGYMMIDTLKIKLHEVDFVLDKNAVAGKVMGLDSQGLCIGCENGYIVIKSLQVAGKSKQSAKEFMNGYQNKIMNAYVNKNL
ncbi:MAG: methionyl-tRNA formyltransferase [Erysipelotrichaceae bacterium]